MRIVVSMLVFLLSLPVLARPEGEFMVGDFDGEEFVFRVLFEDGAVRTSSLREGWKSESELRDAGRDRFEFTLDLESESMDITVIQAAEDELVFSSASETSVLKGWKRGKKPSWLFGEWESPRGRVLIFNEDGASVGKKGAFQEVDVFPLTSERSIARLVLLPKGENKNSALLHFARVKEDVMLVWDLDDGDVRSFTRKGWMSP